MSGQSPSRARVLACATLSTLVFAAFSALPAVAQGAAPTRKPAVAADTTADTTAPGEAECPATLQAVAHCYTGTDRHGATYWIAVPARWNGTLVMHAHGGPRLTPIRRDSEKPDLERFAVTVREGYAWAASSYRRPGYGVRMAAEDTDNLRRIFIQAVGKPRYTIFHGQSWGGNVAAKGIELYGTNADGSRNYDAVLLTSGMIGGGTHNYLHRADLRAVYQFYCHNHPRPDETQYPLWSGLPADATMTPKDLAARIDACTGVKKPAAQRTPEQQRNLDNILHVVRIPERTLISHMTWATFMFRDLTQRVLGGRNPFTNRNVVYRGSDDDAALNRGVQRFDADPLAVAQLSFDADMTGRLPVPVLTIHANDDPIALVEYENAYREVVRSAGRGDRLVQTFTTEHVHSKLADPEYAAAFAALSAWMKDGVRPTPASVAAACTDQATRYTGGCHFDVEYFPKPLFTRVAPRAENFVPRNN